MQKKIVINTNKYHSFSAKKRYATLVNLSTNGTNNYMYIVIKSFLTFIPGKEFIQFGRNPDLFSTIKTKKMLHFNNRGRFVVDV